MKFTGVHAHSRKQTFVRKKFKQLLTHYSRSSILLWPKNALFYSIYLGLKYRNEVFKIDVEIFSILEENKTMQFSELTYCFSHLAISMFIFC